MVEQPLQLLLLLVQEDLLLLAQVVLVPRQQEHVQRQQQHSLQTTHIHLLQVPRTVSTVIVFVMQDLTGTHIVGVYRAPAAGLFTGAGAEAVVGTPPAPQTAVLTVLSILAVR